ncbi:DNA-binding protein, partial [Acinetobacter baumannii]
MQTLIVLKRVQPATAEQHQDAMACDPKMSQHVTTQQHTDNKKSTVLHISENVAEPQQETTAYHPQTVQHATL